MGYFIIQNFVPKSIYLHVNLFTNVQLNSLSTLSLSCKTRKLGCYWHQLVLERYNCHLIIGLPSFNKSFARSRLKLYRSAKTEKTIIFRWLLKFRQYLSLSFRLFIHYRKKKGLNSSKMITWVLSLENQPKCKEPPFLNG